MSARSSRAPQLAGHHHALGLVGALVDPGDHGSALPCQRLRVEPAGSALRGAGPCDIGGVIRTAQVVGSFDLIGRHRYRPARYRKGPPKAHRRSVRGQRKLAQHRPSESRLSAAGRCILQAMRRSGRRGLLPGVVAQMKRRGARRHSSAPVPRRYPDISRVPATARGSRGPCEGQTAGPPVIFRGLGPFTEDGGRNPGASGSVNRSFSPDSVRHMSVTIAAQRRLLTGDDTR